MAERAGALALQDTAAASGSDVAIASLARRRFDRAVALLERGFADPHAIARLSEAGVAVHVEVADLPGAVITLLLDRIPVTFEPHALPVRPHVRLALSSADVERMFSEGEYLPMQILSGAVRFEGPVRKLLRVLPILRAACEAPADGTGPCD